VVAASANGGRMSTAFDGIVFLRGITADASIETLEVATRDGARRILRRARQDRAPGDGARVLLQNEYELLSRCALRCMLRVIEFRSVAGEAALLLGGNVGGDVWQRQIGRGDVQEVLTTAEAVAAAIGETHAAGVLQRAIRPSTILVDATAAYLLDFTRAVARNREHGDIASPWPVVESLSYVAPEQTGRMNRPADYRADYYAFGASLYEVLAGHPPFVADDPLDVIYDHLATRPVPPDQLDPRIPAFLSDIVMKLLEKDPDRRYQSIEGLRGDLRAALAIVRGEAIACPTLGAHDIPDQFDVSHKLYGREPERARLLASYERTCRGEPTLLVLSGYSGIGKTSLIRETYVPVTRQKAFFVSGKFDQLQRRVPYSAWTQALAKLVDFVLAEPDDRLREWQARVGDALGRHAGVLVEIMPPLATLIGPQPKPPDVPPAEALNRFTEAFRAFIGAFCLPDRPLVVFLDDLQWIDAASLSLMEVLARDPTCRHLFLIGAFRDNEVPATHPVALAMQRLRREGAFSIEEVPLPPLSDAHVGQLVQDTFGVSAAVAQPLTDEVARKTAGNPFFVWQFLRALRGRGLVYFDLAAMRWDWRLTAIRETQFSDNVVDLMLQRFGSLPERTRASLSWAACLGSQFDIEPLAILDEQPVPATYDALLPALQDEFLLPMADAEVVDSRLIVRRFRFLHDRMQEAAYRALTPDEATAAHHRIGRMLLAITSPDRLDEQIFDIADHLNLAASRITTVDAREELARVNLRAALKAKESAAYAAALAYVTTAMTAAPEDVWTRDPELAYALWRERGELEYLNSQFDAAERIVVEAIGHDADRFHRATLFNMLVVQYTLRALYPQAIDTAREGLRLFGVALPDDDYAAARSEELRRIHVLLDGRPLSVLADLPPMVDPEQRAVMMLLTSMGPPCYRSHPWLWGVIVAREIRLCLEYGNVPSATYSYPAFGGLLTHVGQGTRQTAAELSDVTRALMRQSDSPADTSVGYLMMGSSLRHWFAPLAAATEDYLDAYRTGVESGNLQYAVYGFGHNTYCRFFQGVPLDELITETLGYLDYSRKRQNRWGIDLTEGALRVFQTLRGDPGKTVPGADFAWHDEAETAYLDRCEAHRNLQVLCIYFVLKAEALLHLGRVDEAAGSLAEAARRLDSVSTQGLLPTPQFHAIRALAVAMAPAAFAVTPEQACREVGTARERFDALTGDCPENFGHLWWLLQAEESRLGGQWWEALEAYDRALTSAREQGFVQRVGLVATRAAELWRDRGKPDLAAPYRREAETAYRDWQADRVLAPDPGRAHGIASFGRLVATTRPGPAGALRPGVVDLARIAHIGQALSRHMALDDLVRALIHEIVVMSGAQRAVFLVVTERDTTVTLDVDRGVEKPAGAVPLDRVDDLPKSVIRYASHTLRTIHVGPETVGDHAPFVDDPYWRTCSSRSLVCIPLVYLGTLHGVLYLEHHEAAEAFQPEVIPLLELVASQAAIAIHNALMLARLRNEVDMRTAAEAQLSAANADLRHFATITAHHLQEPSRRLVTLTQVLAAALAAPQDEAEVHQSLAFIDQQANRLRDLLRDMQRYLAAEQPIGDTRRLDTNAVLAAVLDRLADPIRASGAVITTAPLPPVQMDRARLIEILSAVLDNALRYRRPAVAPEIRIAAERDAGMVRVRVADNGPGIPSVYRERVFRVFERLQGPVGSGGTGIGLALVRRIAAAVGGRAWIEDTPGGGATVVFDLPAGEEPPS